MKTNIVILGSTGSIGRNALKVAELFPDKFRVLGLTAGSNIRLLARQIKKFKPAAVAVYDRASSSQLRRIAKNVEVLEGEQGIKEMCRLPRADVVLNAIMGSAGLKYTVEAILSRKRIALANKESYVMAGGIIDHLLKKYRGRIIPVDSEHSAVFHLLQHRDPRDVESIILTASGGPFLNKPQKDFPAISLKAALSHPTWNMGNKITVDSATMMNKGFEVIEAHHLFHMEYDRIRVVIHPQSIIHSMVQTRDGEIYAQLSPPDMRFAIQSALSFPGVLANPLARYDFTRPDSLTFQKPDMKKFPLLSFAYETGKKGGNLPAALCCADDAAVHRFLHKKLKFSGIAPAIKAIVNSIKYVENPDIDYIFWLEEHIRNKFNS
jgi:1-deoxy-D-xylulose-5-phosphate reductoisomerase